VADDIIERLRTAPPSMLGVRLEAADLIEAQQAEIERLRNLLDAVVEEFNPSCHCDHYPRHDCPCARVRRMLDGLGLPSTNHPEEARRG
jgi:hypothetical protein